MLSNIKPNQFDINDIITTTRQNMDSGDLRIIESIVAELKSFDIYDIISRVSSLNLMIENQNKSILLDALIAAILTHPRNYFRGIAKISNEKFSSIIGRLESLNLRRMIDPAENPFIERIRYYGNYWIFPGINHAPGHKLQNFLNVLCLRDNQFDSEFTHKAHQLINFILHISDSAAHTLCYDLETINRVEQSALAFPNSQLSDRLSGCVRIPYLLVEQLIPDDNLRQRLFIDFGTHNLSATADNDFHEFFAHPFLRADEQTVIILNPSILVPFAIHHLVLLADSFGKKRLLIEAYNNEVWKECKRDLRDLGHRKILESEYGIELLNKRHRKEAILTVGNDKLLFVHFVCDSGIDYNDTSMFGRHATSSSAPSIHERYEYFADKLQVRDRNDIYQLVILNSFGREIGCEITRVESQYSILLSPNELHCISVNERDRAEFIPRYINARKKMKTMLPPILASELNFIEIYTNNDYSFYLSDDYNPATVTAFLVIGDSLDYVIRAVKKENRHLTNSYDGTHLFDIVLSDPVRNIYYAKNTHLAEPQLVVKFNNVNIWFAVGTIDSQESANVLFSIIDAASYWLAEAKDIVNQMVFTTDAICIKVDLLGPVSQYYSMIDNPGDFFSGIKYIHDGNVLKMLWQPASYQLLGKKTDNAERLLLKSLLEELAKFSQTDIDLTALDSLFVNPLKKRVHEINSFTEPYMVPTGGQSPTISLEEEHQLLDEIGAHFLSLPDYDYGKIPDEKRVALTNNIVGYLYSLLQSEIASLSPTNLYEKVCYDLETVMSTVMLAHRRYAYDIACYPENKDRYIEKYSEANRASVSLKFLAEYIAAVPPEGKAPLGSMQYDRILAICSLIIDWGYKNDLFYYKIFNTPLEFLKSDRIGMSSLEGDYLSKISMSARAKRMESLSDPRISVYTPSDPYTVFWQFIDEAFNEEYGFTFNQFKDCILAIADYGDTINSPVKHAQRETLVKEIARKLNHPVECVNSVINSISLGKRNHFLVPPKPYRKEDVYPWRYNRELSFTRRPIIQHDEMLIWGNRQLHHMLRYTVDLIIDGRYHARHPKLKSLIGKLSNIRGKEFNSVVYQKLTNIEGLIVRERLSKVNRKKLSDDFGNDIGDVDIFCIIPSERKIIVGEVKDFSAARNPYELNQEYTRIFVDGEKPCYMTKHKRRVAWIQEHLEDVKAHFGLEDGDWSVRSAMFVNEEIVSNAFYHQDERIIVYSQISEETIKSV